VAATSLELLKNTFTNIKKPNSSDALGNYLAKTVDLLDIRWMSKMHQIRVGTVLSTGLVSEDTTFI